MIRSDPLLLGAACGVGWFRHVLNLMVLAGSVVLGVFFCIDDGDAHRTPNGQGYLYAATALSFFFGWHLVMAIGGADMPVAISMLNSYAGSPAVRIAARQFWLAAGTRAGPARLRASCWRTRCSSSR